MTSVSPLGYVNRPLSEPTPVLDPARWPQRAARSAVFALVSVALAVSAHRVAGGMTTDLRVAAAGGLVLFGLGLAMSGRERCGRVIGAVVAASQVALHAGFSLATQHGPTGPSMVAQWARAVWCAPATHPATAAQVDTMRAGMGMTPIPGATPMSHMPATLSAAGLGMLAAHLGAAAATAWWLRRGERAAWSLACHVVATIAWVMAAPVLRCVDNRPSTAPVWVPGHRIWVSAVTGRGPPAAAAVWSIPA